MKRRAAAYLVRLYPAAWRVRYGDEFHALLCELPLTFAVVCDTVAHAAMLRRRALPAAVLAVAVPIAVIAAFHGHAGGPATSAVHPERSALPPCSAYSSTSDSRFVQAARCLT